MMTLTGIYLLSVELPGRSLISEGPDMKSKFSIFQSLREQITFGFFKSEQNTWTQKSG